MGPNRKPKPRARARAFWLSALLCVCVCVSARVCWLHFSFLLHYSHFAVLQLLLFLQNYYYYHYYHYYHYCISIGEHDKTQNWRLFCADGNKSPVGCELATHAANQLELGPKALSLAPIWAPIVKCHHIAYRAPKAQPTRLGIGRRVAYGRQNSCQNSRPSTNVFGHSS